MATVSETSVRAITITLTESEAIAIYNLFGNSSVVDLQDAGLPNLYPLLDTILADSPPAPYSYEESRIVLFQNGDY